MESQRPDPRFEEKLIANKTFTAKEAEEIKERIAKDVDAAVDFAKESPMPSASAMMEDVYA